jgi:hypothetical protein
MLGLKGPNLSEMRNGKRACPIGLRARIAQLAGHDTIRAILEGLADKLDPTDEYEEQALLQLSALINAFPEEGEQVKSPVNPKINRASLAWRNRRDSNPR